MQFYSNRTHSDRGFCRTNSSSRRSCEMAHFWVALSCRSACAAAATAISLASAALRASASATATASSSLCCSASNARSWVTSRSELLGKSA
eukprot:5654611-Pleurochrysis_carterae.AAC.2